MQTAKAVRRRMEVGAAQIQPALRTLGQLRRAIADGAELGDVMLLMDELTSDLLRCEDAVGCVTPAALFDTVP
jgi:hypothetical protein